MGDFVQWPLYQMGLNGCFGIREEEEEKKRTTIATAFWILKVPSKQTQLGL